MHWFSRGTKRLTFVSICFIFLAGALRILAYNTPDGYSGAPLAAATPIIYVGIFIAWIISLDWRILDRGIRQLLIASAFLMIFYMLIRTAKYQFFSTQQIILRHLWYAYYIPMILIPLLQFLAALRVGKHEKQPMPARWRLLFLPAILLALAFITNDLHQMAFKFQKGFVGWETDYSRGALYIATAAWNVLLLLAALAVALKKCSKSYGIKGIWMPFAVLLAGGAYMIWGLTDHFVTAKKVFQLPEVFCFMIVAFWEILIQISIVPSNIGYSVFFGLSTIAAQIANERHEVIYCSQNAPALTPLQMAAAKHQPTLISPDIRLHSHAIAAGHIYWTEDLSTLNALSEQLQEIGETLAEENELINVENRIKQQQAKLAEQNRLYDGIARMAAPQLKKIDELLAELTPGAADFSRRVGHACVLNAYIKRRGNLMLIAENQLNLQAADLSHCIRESVEYLRVYGVLCSFEVDTEGRIAAKQAALAYDFFQAVVEKALPGITSLMIHLFIKHRQLVLRMSMEDASSHLSMHWRRDELRELHGAFVCEEADGTVFITLRFGTEDG